MCLTEIPNSQDYYKIHLEATGAELERTIPGFVFCLYLIKLVHHQLEAEISCIQYQHCLLHCMVYEKSHPLQKSSRYQSTKIPRSSLCCTNIVILTDTLEHALNGGKIQRHSVL